MTFSGALCVFRWSRANRQTRVLSQIVTASSSLILCSPALASWTTISLHNPAHVSSQALHISGTQVVGFADVGPGAATFVEASLWSASTQARTNLNTPSFPSAVVNANSNNTQVGYVGALGNFSLRRAAMWNGSSGTYVDLHPANALHSEAHDASGGVQVGRARFDGIQSAVLWSGSAASVVNLHPSGAVFSEALGADGGVQVGRIINSNNALRAALWTGTAASFVDLNPVGASESSAFDAIGGMQVGFANLSGFREAGLWNGSAASWQSLHPAVASASQANAIFGSYQGGFAQYGNATTFAAFWSGSAGSYEDLHQYLPAGYTESWTHGISVVGNDIYAVGWAQNAAGAREAWMWTRPIPAPGAAAMLGLGGMVAMRRRRVAHL